MIIDYTYDERNTLLEFPKFYPPNCPEEGFEPASGTVYRLVLNNPVQAEDFESPFEEKSQRFKNKPNKIKCRSCGLSVHTNPQDSETLKKWVGKLRNAQIAKGELNTTLGVIKYTPSTKSGESHVSWWVPVGAEPWAVFEVVEEKNDY